MNLICKDARTVKLSPHTRATLVYADPPSSRQTNEMAGPEILDELEYKEFAFKWIQNMLSYLAPDGRLVICTWHKQRYLYESIMRTQFPQVKFEQEIIWSYNFGLYTRKRFVSAHDNILVYKQGSPPFNWEDVAVPSQRLQAGDKRADLRGRTPSSVWNISRVPGNSFQRRHLSGYKRTSQPEDLCRRLVLAYTNVNQLVIDTFAGSGTMALTARRNHRDMIAIDYCQAYLDEILIRKDHRMRDAFNA